MNEQTVYDPAMQQRSAVVRRISWAAIFAGLIITLVVELLLGVLGISIGASTINPLTEQNPAQGLGIGAGIWFIITSIIALYFGGWVAGRMSGFALGVEGTLHGLVTWGVATLLTVYLFSSAMGGLLSGTANMLGHATQAAISAEASGQGGVGGAVQNVVTGGSDSVRQEVQKLSQGSDSSNPAQTSQLVSAVEQMLSHGANVQPADREAVVSLLVSQNLMEREQAEQTVDRWINSSQQIKAQTEQKTRKAADVAARGMSAAGWWSFATLMLTAIAAGLGGSNGAMAFIKNRSRAVSAA